MGSKTTDNDNDMLTTIANNRHRRQLQLKREEGLTDVDIYSTDPNARVATGYNLNSHYKRMLLFYQDKVRNKLTPLQRRLRKEKNERRRLSRIKKKKEKAEILSMILSTDIRAQNYSFDENDNENESENEISDKMIENQSQTKDNLQSGIRLSDGNIMFMGDGSINSRRPKTQRRKFVNTDSQIYLTNENSGEMKNVTQKMTFGHNQDLDLIGIANDA